jgi:hypothetical protein
VSALKRRTGLPLGRCGHRVEFQANGPVQTQERPTPSSWWMGAIVTRAGTAESGRSTRSLAQTLVSERWRINASRQSCTVVGAAVSFPQRTPALPGDKCGVGGE